jgi:hypothetical protein
VLDFFTGIWPIYKTIAGIDLAQAGLITGISGFFGEFLQPFFGYFSDRGLRKKVFLPPPPFNGGFRFLSPRGCGFCRNTFRKAQRSQYFIFCFWWSDWSVDFSAGLY